MVSKSTLLKIAVNTLIGVILVFIWLKFVDINQIWATLSKVELISITPIIFFLFLSVVLRALRLKVFLRPIKNISAKDLIFLNGAALMLNYLIPIRGGEIAKGVYLSTQYQIPVGKSLVWIFLDRFIDFLVVLILASLLFLVVPTTLNITFITIIIIIFSTGLVVTYLMTYQSIFFRKIVKFLSNLLIVNNIKIYFERICNFFLDSFEILRRSPKDLSLLFLVTILAYAADAGVWYSAYLAIGTPQEYIKLYLGQLLSALTYLVPAAPGYVGSAEASGLLIFSGVFGIEPNLASAMTVLFHVTTTIFILTFGVISIYFLKLDIGMIIRKVLRK
ncbi:MAG: Uncharacterized protein CEO21_340 [Microgenomates group bacterium Gr01-1014_80]|nr:MAG: Uncharacterized protein CEO21_340 [Microgenomates group bacterium Gr01-1014_80]